MSEITKSIVLLVVPLCPYCNKPVGATKNDKAVRHGFKRHKLGIRSPTKKFSQEDGTPCIGTGREVIYKRVK